MNVSVATGHTALSIGPSTGIGPDSILLKDYLLDANLHFEAPVSRHSLGTKFQDLAETWRLETAYASSAYDITMHSAYQQIIGLGPQVIPLVLRELRRQPDQWFWALKALTCADPVNDEDRGDLHRMTDAWVQWGEDVHYL